MATISQTITNLGPVAKRGTVSRGEYVASREDWEDHLTQVTVGEINTWSTQANAVRNEVNSNASIAQTSATTATTKASIATTAASTAEAAKNAIQGYVVPTEATYTYSDIDLKNSANFISSGVINKQDDSIEFNASIGNEYKLQDNSRFFNFDGKVIELPNGIEIDMTDNMPEVTVHEQNDENGLVVQSSVNAGDYVVVDKEELVTNGTFDTSDLSSFTASASTLSVEDGKLKITKGTTTYGTGSANISGLIIGVKYKVKFDAIAGTSSQWALYNGGSVLQAYTSTFATGLTFTFVATSTGLSFYSKDDDSYGYFDNISVQLASDVYRATEYIESGVSLTDSRFEDRTQFGITNKILATMKDDGTIKTEVCFVDTAIEHCGNAHVVMTDNGYIRVDDKKGLYTKDGDVVTPIGTWSTLNKGAFHPVYNYFGTAFYNDGGSWTTTTTINNSTADIYINKHLTSYTGSILLQPTANLQDKYYDIIYPDQWIDLRIEANSVSEQDELNRVGTKVNSGQLDGVGGVVATYEGIDPFASSSTNFVFTASSWYGEFLEPNEKNYQTDSFENKYHVFIYEDTGETITAYCTNCYQYSANNIYGPILILDTSIDKARGVKLLYTLTLPHPSSGTALKPEVLANPDRYSDDMKDRLASGLPLLFEPNLVDDTGASNIPDGSKTTFKLNNKFTTTHQVLKSTDKGVNWSPLTLTTHYTVNTITNSITFTAGNIPLSTDMIMISNTAVNMATQVTDPKAVKLVGNYVTGTNSHSRYKGNQLVPTGKVNVGNGDNGLESKVVENSATIGFPYDIIDVGNPSALVSTLEPFRYYRIVGSGYTNVSTGDLVYSTDNTPSVTGWYPSSTSFESEYFIKVNTPSHSTISLDNSNSPAVKFIETIAEDDDGMAHYQVFAQELAYNSDTSSYDGDTVDSLGNGTFTQLTNGTLKDLNWEAGDPEIKTIVSSIPLNKYIGDK
jgi:hypothetical protein